MRKEIRGFGMTAEEWSVPDTPEEKKAAWRAGGVAWLAGNSFEIEIATIEQWAREQLVALGFKDRAAFWEHPVGDSLGDRAGEYAAMALKYIDVVRKAITDNNAQEAARFGVLIGETFALIQTTLEWEKFGLTGKATKKSLDTGRPEGVKARQTASKKKLARIKTAVEDLRNNGPKMTAEEMRDFLHARKLSPYSPGSTLRHIKTFAAQSKKKR
jgi:hypothetical protein